MRIGGALSRKTALLMAFKPVTAASRIRRRPKGGTRSPMFVAGVTFTNSVAATAPSRRHRAARSAASPEFEHGFRKTRAEQLRSATGKLSAEPGGLQLQSICSPG